MPITPRARQPGCHFCFVVFFAFTMMMMVTMMLMELDQNCAGWRTLTPHKGVPFLFRCVFCVHHDDDGYHDAYRVRSKLCGVEDPNSAQGE